MSYDPLDDYELEEAPTQEQRKRRYLWAALLLVGSRLELDLKTGVSRTGLIPYNQVADAFYRAHREAAWIGVELAGGAYLTPQEVHVLAARITAEQQSYWAKFEKDVREGRYLPRSEGGRAATEAGGQALLQARIDLYKRRLIGTANQAWLMVLGRDPNEEGLWELGQAEHCLECPKEAAKGWRPLSSFTRVPGDGSTPCLTNCQCTIITRSGRRSFSAEALNLNAQGTQPNTPTSAPPPAPDTGSGPSAP